MKKVRMVTRTIESTYFSVLTMDTETAEVATHNYCLSGYIDETEYSLTRAMKTLKKEHETDTYKLVKITSVTHNETLYGLSEMDFIKYAEVLPSRGTKTDD